MIKRMILISCLLSGISCVSLNAMRLAFLDPSRRELRHEDLERNLCKMISDNTVDSPELDATADARAFGVFMRDLNRFLEGCAPGGKLDLDLVVDFRDAMQGFRQSPNSYVQLLVDTCTQSKKDATVKGAAEYYERKLQQLRQVQEALNNYRPRPRKAVEAESHEIGSHQPHRGGRSRRGRKILAICAFFGGGFIAWKLFNKVFFSKKN